MKIDAEVDIDPESVMDEVDDDDLLAYLHDRGIDNFSDRDLVNEFFHGDFDLKKMFRDIGKNEVMKVIKEFITEENIKLYEYF